MTSKICFKKIRVRFTEHRIHRFKVMAHWHSVHSHWCATSTSVQFQGFSSPQRKAPATEQSLLVPSPFTSVNHQSAFCVYEFTDSGQFVEVKTCGLLCLAPFTEYNVFQVHPRCSRCQNLIPWGGLNNIPCVYIPEYAFFVYFLHLIVVKYTEHKTYRLTLPVWLSG